MIVKAIILAAGIGRRMRPLTDDCHKTLLEVGGQTIIGRILEGLQANSVTEVCIVTGYRADEVEEYVTREFTEFDFQFIRNERFASTNNIYSMALALEGIELDTDVLLIESDLLYEPSVITKLMKSEHPNVALVDRYRIGLDGTVGVRLCRWCCHTGHSSFVASRELRLLRQIQNFEHL